MYNSENPFCVIILVNRRGPNAAWGEKGGLGHEILRTADIRLKRYQVLRLFRTNMNKKKKKREWKLKQSAFSANF